MTDHQPPTAGVDLAYLERVKGHMVKLERSEIAIRQDIAHTQQEFVRGAADIEMEAETLKKELHALDIEVKRTVERVKTTILKFRTVVKKGDLQRLQSRIDMWAPADKLSRVHLIRMLNDM